MKFKIHVSSRALDKREYLVIIGDNLLILVKNVCCDLSSEPSH